MANPVNTVDNALCWLARWVDSIAATNIDVYQATVTTSWTSATSGYTQTIYVAGMTANTTILNVFPDGTSSEAQLEAFEACTSFETGTDAITVSTDSATSSSVNIIIVATSATLS